MKKTLYLRFFKRPLDLLISIIAIVIFVPIFLTIGLLVKINLGSPVIFKQFRPGLDEKIFSLYKFRTMNNKRDINGSLLPDELRLTKFGKFLRSTSLDELPSLFNIVKGEMSIIGPRPFLQKDLIFISKSNLVRQTVRPGLTGLAQIKGRNNLDWDLKFVYDLQYISNINFISDFIILFLTFYKVITKKDINSKGTSTSEDYGEYLLNTGKITEEQYNLTLNNFLSSNKNT